MPPVPDADDADNRPAVAFARAVIARRIIRDRTAAGLSQAQRARRAGIRVETLNRIERAKITPDTATIAKIDRALRAGPPTRRRPVARKPGAL
jgi:transcriptional regulator with XRE-family HTH domain